MKYTFSFRKVGGQPSRLVVKTEDVVWLKTNIRADAVAQQAKLTSINAPTHSTKPLGFNGEWVGTQQRVRLHGSKLLAGLVLPTLELGSQQMATVAAGEVAATASEAAGTEAAQGSGAAVMSEYEKRKERKLLKRRWCQMANEGLVNAEWKSAGPAKKVKSSLFYPSTVCSCAHRRIFYCQSYSVIS
jgi:hypothetical protein